jgi:hypothetical protein
MAHFKKSFILSVGILALGMGAASAHTAFDATERSATYSKLELSTPDMRPVVSLGIQSPSASGPVFAAKTKSKNSQYQNSGSTVVKGRGPNAR